MRICRHRLRLFLKSPLFKSTFKLTALFLLLGFCFVYVQEKREKETLIDLALGSGRVDDLVKPDNDTIIIGSGTRLHKNPFVVVLVTTLPENLERRTIIRKTWASRASDFGASVIFFTGRPQTDKSMKLLQAEARRHEDLVVDDFDESYYALSVKTLRALKYFKFHHPQSKFLVKTDDDVFVNVLNLAHYCDFINRQIESEQNKQSTKTSEQKVAYFVGGVIHSERGPHTWNPFSKWYAPVDIWKSVYDTVVTLGQVQIQSANSDQTFQQEGNEEVAQTINDSQYPPYAEGNFYIMSDDTVLGILKVSRQVPLYHLEDVYVTGVLATWMLKITKETTPFVSSSSNMFPKLSYAWYKMSTSPKEIMAFHCDNHVELISKIYQDSIS